PAPSPRAARGPACRRAGYCGTRRAGPCRRGCGWQRRCRRPGCVGSWRWVRVKSREWGKGNGEVEVAGRRGRVGVRETPLSLFPIPAVALVPQRLPRLQGVHDPLLRLRHLREGDEVLALEAEQPVLVHAGAAVDLAAAEHGGDAAGDLVVVLADEPALDRKSVV